MKYSIEPVVKKLTNLLEKNRQSKKVDNSNPINTLAPKIITDQSDLNKIRPYIDSLKQAIDTKDVNNIALTGSYGSGKSTILKTFQYLYPEYKYMNVSLASFKDNNDDDALERKLEISILQQIFYHVEPSVIPDSRFKRIINLSSKKLLIQTVFVIIWALSNLFLFKFNKIDKLNPEGWYPSYKLDWIALFSILVFFLGVGFLIKNVYRLFSNSKINKLNIKGEFELGETIDKSVFNQHLEEILYFFERTDFNVLVIEDVDRFNSTGIFTKLREINTLINNSNLIKRRVKFIYAIKDEMFKDKNERVKFFEFIIPVIPFINPSNAGDQLAKFIKKANLEGVLSPDFTSDVVTFIDDIDMRLLINIFHEFLIYRGNLSKDLVQDNLFAIIVYKNMFPYDFGKLGKRKGNLYKFLSNRGLYVTELVNKIASQITIIEQRIALIESEIEKPIEELRAVYINRVVSKIGNFHSFYTNRNVSLVEAVNDEHFSVLKASKNIQYVPYTSDYYSHDVRASGMQDSGISFSSIEKEVSNRTYDQREKFLTEKLNNGINLLKAEKEKLKNKISEIESLSIREIFEQVDIDQYLGKFKENYLMRNLLINGYIDEHYDDYISLFHEVSLTKDDFAFERKVKSGYNSDFNYSITKAEGILKRLPDKYFKREAILNFDLIKCLLENKSKYKTKYEQFFKGLSIDGERQFQFLCGFINRDVSDLHLFIEDLCRYKPSLWQYLNLKSGLPEEERRNILRLVFEYAKIESILKFNDLNVLVNYIKQMEDFFAFCSTLNNKKNIQAFIASNKVSFEKLDIPGSSCKEIFDYIYVNNFYSINEHNIAVIVNFYEKPIDVNELKKAHYSTLLKSGLNNLLLYISNSLENYIENVMLMIAENVTESETTIISILNNEDISTELKSKLVEGQATIISEINNVIDNDERQILLDYNKLKPVWGNIYEYLDGIEDDDFDETLIGFLNRKENYLELSKRKLNDGVDKDEEYIKNISSNLIHSSELLNDAFSFLLKSIPYTYNRVSYGKINVEQIEVMLSHKFLNLTVDNFDGLKSKGGTLHIKLIESHQAKFTEEFVEFSLDTNDWLLILKSQAIKIENKLSLIQNFDDSIIVENRLIANTVCNLLPVNEYIPLRFEVLSAMFKANTSVQKRIALLILHFENLDNNQIQILTEELGDDYARMFMKQHKPVFANAPYNISLFIKLEERDLIIRFEVIGSKNVIKVYAKY